MVDQDGRNKDKGMINDKVGMRMNWPMRRGDRKATRVKVGHTHTHTHTHTECFWSRARARVCVCVLVRGVGMLVGSGISRGLCGGTGGNPPRH